MTGKKRRISSSEGPSAKRRVTEAIVISDDEDESLEHILAQIKAQEESEALARRLQEEWNGAASDSTRAGSNLPGPSSAPAGCQEDDEALARRLAEEWEKEDGAAAAGSSAAATLREQPTLNASNTKGKAPYTSGADETPDEALRQFQTVFTAMRKCQCGHDIPSPRGYVTFSAEIPPPSLLFLLHAPCSRCKTNYCRGCMNPISCPVSCKGGGKSGGCLATTCCAQVRAIALFETLGGLDRQYIGERATSEARAREAAAKNRRQGSQSVGPGGTGYGIGTVHAFGNGSPYHNHNGRGRNTPRASPSMKIGTSRTEILAAHWDEIVVRAFATISHFLPSPYSESPQMYDMIPHQTIAALLGASQLPELLGILLRNDSVTDWAARITVYYAMLSLLRRLADCEVTIEVLTGPRWELEKSCGLEEWMWGEGDIVWSSDKSTGSGDKRLIPATPLYAHFKKLTKQCETFLAGANSVLGDADDHGDDAETVFKLTALCGDIIAARDDIERAMKVMGRDASASTPIGPENQTEIPLPQCKDKGEDSAVLERMYAQECEHLAFEHVTLSKPSADGNGLVYPTFAYAQELARTATATRNPKDRLHLVKELAVMATSLPPGVWVRVDEVRNDVIKIMIAGPQGTPYSGGLFEFDCFIPLEYPYKPPLMHLRTTGGGTVRFNPNLYNNGKVCLSLLGTWPGQPEEQWSPKSTLLQVVVSIQSMILIDLPYFNEPGYGRAVPEDPRSIAYNRDVAANTIRWAILDWLKDEHRDGIWADVIVSHFALRRTNIRKFVQEHTGTHPIRSHHQSQFFLTEFDRGIKRIQGWKKDKTG
ncbi:hypothetical protein OBBRIDRAFT_744889 [Obba rivulosa]|uniref:UBC core domain-containing protein n=1 Tax=Obba rivulosa TaxID=1052685 RepID=A0A8E2DTU5_9APHY|nr:hypothetical protein OBBRIDRAFT_744889 [Obba rivulosa]